MSQRKPRPIKKIQQEILRTLIILASIMTILVAVISILVNIKSESKRLDQNLQNVAQAIAQSQVIQNGFDNNHTEESYYIISPYLNSLKDSLSNIDVISVVGADGIRKYHTNADLINTVYDGTIPTFQYGENVLSVTSDTGPSGSQRRAYAAIYDKDGNYSGFVLAVMLNQNINRIIFNAVIIHLICAVGVIFCAIILSHHLSKKVKKLLLGYEPDTFSAMFSIRDNILESLDEGILAVDIDEKIIYMNKAARNILHIQTELSSKHKISEICPYLSMNHTLSSGEKCFKVLLHPSQSDDVFADYVPVKEQEHIIGALCILRDRTEYTKMMEDLSGVRYLVDCMRANNHDFVNKLHVILGLIQMGNTAEASEYITHITTIQQTLLHNIMKNIEDPSVAALLIGKYACASELNIRFTLKNGSKLSRNDIALPSSDLVTIIGNLLDNAMDSMNEKENQPKNLEIGIFTKPHAMIISIDDTGKGITPENQSSIFNNGFSTKGENRGTGLFIVNSLIQKYGGDITVESELDVGTSFTVTLTDEGGI